MPKKTYTQTDFESALERVQSGEISLRAAEFEYGIQISTLCNHKNGKFSSLQESKEFQINQPTIHLKL